MSLEQRVERLERENRRLKLAGGAVVAVLLIVALVGAVMPQGIPEVIDARMFRVVDESGTVRATLGASAIRYFDENSHQHVRMSDEGITYFDEDHNMRATLGRTEIVTPSTGATTTYPAAVVLYDAEGNVIWQAPR